MLRNTYVIFSIKNWWLYQCHDSIFSNVLSSSIFSLNVKDSAELASGLKESIQTHTQQKEPNASEGQERWLIVWRIWNVSVSCRCLVTGCHGWFWLQAIQSPSIHFLNPLCTLAVLWRLYQQILAEARIYTPAGLVTSPLQDMSITCLISTPESWHVRYSLFITMWIHREWMSW